MKARKTALWVLVAVLVCAAVGSVSAFMIKRAQGSADAFQTAKVECRVDRADTGGKTTVTVKNTGNVAAYVRVQLVAGWKGSDGNLYYQSVTELAVSDGSGWVRVGNTFYYPKAVSAGEKVTLSLGTVTQGNAPTTDENVTINDTLEILAGAVQADPIDAVKALWGVTVDAKGTITAEP